MLLHKGFLFATFLLITLAPANAAPLDIFGKIFGSGVNLLNQTVFNPIAQLGQAGSAAGQMFEQLTEIPKNVFNLFSNGARTVLDTGTQWASSSVQTVPTYVSQAGQQFFGQQNRAPNQLEPTLTTIQSQPVQAAPRSAFNTFSDGARNTYDAGTQWISSFVQSVPPYVASVGQQITGANQPQPISTYSSQGFQGNGPIPVQLQGPQQTGVYGPNQVYSQQLQPQQQQQLTYYNPNIQPGTESGRNLAPLPITYGYDQYNQQAQQLALQQAPQQAPQQAQQLTQQQVQQQLLQQAQQQTQQLAQQQPPQQAQQIAQQQTPQQAQQQAIQQPPYNSQQSSYVASNQGQGIPPAVQTVPYYGTNPPNQQSFTGDSRSRTGEVLPSGGVSPVGDTQART